MPEYITQSTGSEILPDGSEWDFIVEDAHEKQSQAGNMMIELKLRILNRSGGKGPLIYDNLVFLEKAFWKLDQFREATGEKLVQGQRVIFGEDDCLDRRGRLVVMIDNYQGKTRNKVDFYVAPSIGVTEETRSEPVAVSTNELGEPDNIPF